MVLYPPLQDVQKPNEAEMSKLLKPSEAEMRKLLFYEQDERK